MLAAFMTLHVHCSKQARSCLSPAVRADKFCPTHLFPFFGGAVRALALVGWLSLASALHTSRFLWIWPSLNDQAYCFSPFLDGRSVPFDAPRSRSGGGDMQILLCFKVFLVC